MIIHFVSYVLFIFSMLLYLFLYASQRSKVISYMTTIICISTLVSQVILVHIFIKICVGENSAVGINSNYLPTINRQQSTEEESSSEDEEDIPVIERPNS